MKNKIQIIDKSENRFNFKKQKHIKDNYYLLIAEMPNKEKIAFDSEFIGK